MLNIVLLSVSISPSEKYLRKHRRHISGQTLRIVYKAGGAGGQYYRPPVRKQLKTKEIINKGSSPGRGCGNSSLFLNELIVDAHSVAVSEQCAK